MKIQLKHLIETFNFWEEFNFLAEINFQTFHKFGKKILPFLPMIGSEVAAEGPIARSIKNYQALRSRLESSEQIISEEFMPRIPTELRSKLTSIEDFLEGKRIASMFLFPKFLQNWLNGKKVCDISNDEKIEMIDPTVNNFLNYLPYESFILQTNTPLVQAFDEGTAIKLHYQFFMIFREYGVIRVLCIPNESVTDVPTSENTKKKLKSLMKFLSLGNKKEFLKLSQDNDLNLGDNSLRGNLLSFEPLRISVETGKVYDVSKVDFKSTELTLIENVLKNFMLSKDLKNLDPKDAVTELVNRRNLVCFPFFLNGLCKLLANYQPPEVKLISLEDLGVIDIEIDNEKAERSTPLDSVLEGPCAWYEVPESGVTYITIQKPRKKGAPAVFVNNGREMPPHLRRSHMRHFKDKDGKIVKKVTIKQSIVRKDKLKNEKFVGSVSTFK